jgi:hypothetical protein
MMRRLESSLQRSLRTICGVPPTFVAKGGVSYAQLLKRSKLNLTMEAMVIERRLNWFGKVWRMKWDRLPKMVLFGVMNESNGNTGQKSYRQQVKQDLIKFGFATVEDTESWKEFATSKQKWKKKVREMRDVYFMRRFYEKEIVKHEARAVGKRKKVGDVEEEEEEEEDEEDDEEEVKEEEVKKEEVKVVFVLPDLVQRTKRHKKERETLIPVKGKRGVRKRKKGTENSRRGVFT